MPTEYEVRFRRTGGCMMVSAESQEAAEAIARKDGHDVKPKVEIDEETRQYAICKKEKHIAQLSEVMLAARSHDKLLYGIMQQLSEVRLNFRTSVFDSLPDNVGEQLSDTFFEKVRNARLDIATALGALRVALPAAEEELSRVAGMDPLDYLNEYPD